MAKTGREKIRLNSSAGTGHFYTTTKNKRTMTEKMEIKKFDPVARKHVICSFDLRLVGLIFKSFPFDRDIRMCSLIFLNSLHISVMIRVTFGSDTPHGQCLLLVSCCCNAKQSGEHRSCDNQC